MKYDKVTRTFDCDPALTDTQVLDFCRNGFLVLEGVVDDETNHRTCDHLNGKIPINPSYIPEGFTNEDLERIRNSEYGSTLILEDWFVEQVFLNPQLAGALRSLLGKNVGLPVTIGKHSVQCPASAQGWHHDADCVFGPEVNYLEVFYYPQDTPVEMGPTAVVPGSHIVPSVPFRGVLDPNGRTLREAEEKGVVTAAPAGSFVVHSQSILHRRSESTAKGLRQMLKYNYWRTVPPERDWIVEPDFDFRTADYGGHDVARYFAHMFYWLCGKGDEFRIIGGQAWPWRSANQIGPSYGFGATEGYLPDWRRANPDGYTR
jgi:hypothetical protein